MEKIKTEINFTSLPDNLKYITYLLFSESRESSCLTKYSKIFEKKEIADKTRKENNSNNSEISKNKNNPEINYEILPHPIFKVKNLPNQNMPYSWFENMEKNSLNIPTFVGKFKELIYRVRPQMILEDLEGNEINIILDFDEDFDYLQQWMLDLKYEVGKFVFVYDAFKIELGEKKCCIVIDGLEKMSNENWICRLKPKRGISSKYVPKIIFALFMLLICYIYDLK
jgi:hypothetical protein